MFRMLLLWLRSKLSGSPCWTAEDLCRFREKDRKRRLKFMYQQIDYQLARHNFEKPIMLSIPKDMSDLTVDLQNQYASAGFDAKWLGNPDAEKEEEFPHVIRFAIKGVTYES